MQLRIKKSNASHSMFWSYAFMCAYLAIMTLLWGHSVSGFNLAPEASLMYHIPQYMAKDSYFGYAVGILPVNRWLVVGSPRANSTHRYSSPNVLEPGAVFKCDLDTPFSECIEVLIDERGNGFGYSPLTNGVRDNGWLGGSLDTYSDGYAEEDVLICAPRFTVRHRYRQMTNIPGYCYTINGKLEDWRAKKVDLLSNQMPDISTLRNDASESQLGISVHYLNSKGHFLIGAPGYHLWDGSIIERFQRGNYHIHSPIERVEFSYLGMSVGEPISGRYGKSIGGAPGHQSNGGKVYAFFGSSTIERNGYQLGENFGGAVYSVDLNHDGLKDLIVGAPTYINKEGLDVGCIYVFVSTSRVLSSKSKRVFGSKTRGSRFGTSITSPGDLDKDGYNDVIVGAPYENDGVGGIYVFQGSSSGIVEQYTQHITPLNLPQSASLRGFGVSFSRSYDVDKNNYIDIAVGSFLSGHVIVLRSRPVVLVNSVLESNPKRITRDINQVTISTCIEYSGYRVPSVLDFDLVLTTDPSKKQKTAFFDNLSSKQQRVKAFKEKQKCNYHAMVIKHNKNRMPVPIVVQLSLSLAYPNLQDHQLTLNAEEGTNYTIDPLEKPVLHPKAREGYSTTISIEDACQDNPDQICISDLYITGNFVNYQHGDYLLVGSDDRVAFKITGGNRGQTAYLPTLFVSVVAPYDLYLPDEPECDRKVDDYTTNFTCTWPLPLEQGVQFKDVIFDVDVSRIENDSPPLKIFTEISSNSKEKYNDDNHQSIELPLEIEAFVDLKWSMDQDTVYYPRIKRDIINTTKPITVVQNLLLVKRGPTPLRQTHLSVDYPSHDRKCNRIATITGTTTRHLDQEFECIDHPLMTNDSNIDKGSYPCDNDGTNMTRNFVLDCSEGSGVLCSRLVCFINNWPKGSHFARMSMYLEFDLKNLEKIIRVANGTNYTTWSRVELQTSTYHQNYFSFNSSTATYKFSLMPKALPGRYRVPWNWLFLAIFMGILILLAIMCCMYKFGFFKRKKDELQPLTATVEEENSKYN